MYEVISMNLNDNNDTGNLFYSTDNGKTFKQFSEISEITIHLTEESAAKLWAMVEGLEIVPRND